LKLDIFVLFSAEIAGGS